MWQDLVPSADGLQEPEGETGLLLEASGNLIEQDAINKINAGAQLIHMLYHHPHAQALLTSDFATPGFVKAYGKACGAYGVGGV